MSYTFCSDPLYLEIGSKFIEIQTEVYGTSHYYNVDTFNEVRYVAVEIIYVRICP